MANSLVVGMLVEFKVYARCQGQWSVNTLHYAVTSVEGAGATDASAAIEFSSIFAPEWIACMSNKARLEGITAQVLSPTRLPRILFTGDGGDGGVDGDVLPRQVAGLVRKLTNVASRHGRGRLFIPFPSEASNDEQGFPEVAYQTSLLSIAALLDDPIEAGGGGNTATLDPVVLDRSTLTGLLITSGSVASNWATCRRRQDSRGADRPPF